jgi:hypothetical protein
MNNVETAFAQGANAMRELWDGATLMQAASDVLRVTRPAPTAFLSTSSEGAALAAVCAALRADGSVWRKVNLLVDAPRFDLPVVFVEPVAAGAAWTAAMRNRYPDATAVVPTWSAGYPASAASAAAAA